ncbi:hypothetical protein KFL_002110010 [Klebsormidium nitens]|uniref:Myb/SANT-like DNA-binding domain-containing protein n=1 Tax=Klebsormidium nitens TaxID=105231 RepID=A0A1Y1I9W6_KLENI|nr:hypothetical protein KFL_002110010 [Klebsormidium nitens]|eukprot:GAQ84888.1 hypothetical protein KFL_002110010 [Klebsormidium nitens]
MEGRQGEASTFRPDRGFLGNLALPTDSMPTQHPAPGSTISQQQQNAPGYDSLETQQYDPTNQGDGYWERPIHNIQHQPQGPPNAAFANPGPDAPRYEQGGLPHVQASSMPGGQPPMTATPEAVDAPTTKKRGRPAGSKSTKTPATKKKTDKAPAIDPELLQEAQSRLWKDEWIHQLIEQRALMQAQFDAPKQGVDLWTRVATEVLANCPDFNKNAESCRKRFAKELKDYQLDKAQNAKSGHDRGDRSKFYDTMDSHFAGKATVHCVAHADSEAVVDVPSGESEEKPSSSGHSLLDSRGKRKRGEKRESRHNWQM